MAVVLPQGRQYFEATGGGPGVGYRLYAFVPGTSTPKDTYTTSVGNVANTHPVVMDARGEAAIYWDGSYDVVLRDAADALVWGPERLEETGSADDLEARLASTASASNGANLLAYSPALAYTLGLGAFLNYTFGRSAGEVAAAVTPTNYAFPPGHLWRYLPAAELADIIDGSSTYDCTTAAGNWVLANTRCFAPAGVYNINPDTGITLRSGLQISGEGRNKTVFVATAQGGTTAELAAYTKGSVFKRAFTVAPGTNSYMVDIRLSDFCVILTHPTATAITSTEIQIGIDLRNITRSHVERVHVGNVTPLGCLYVKSDPGTYAAQGYGIVIGNVSQSESSYCGGEVNTIRDCFAWGAYKGIVMDDATLSPNSAAHATVVEACDIQACHNLLVQEQQYTAGFTWEKNTLQNVITQPGGGGGTRYVMRIAGYNNIVHAGYIEAGSTDYLLRFDSASSANKVFMSHYGATTIATAAFSDIGRLNTVEAFLDTGTNAGGVDSLGAPVTRYDRAYKTVWQKFHWDGGAIVNDGGFGITITRPAGAGDYLATFALAFISDDAYTMELHFDSNASGHPGTSNIVSHTTSNCRFTCFTQNGATTTAIDPRFVWVRFTQCQ